MSIQQELENVQPAKLKIQNVSKTFVTHRGSLKVLENISLDVEEGEFLCILGESGCGKSTLLNIIAGLESANEGTIMTNGKPITGPGRDRMVMFQDSALFPWLDVMSNVMYGLKLKPNLTDPERKEVAAYYLKLVGLEKFHHSNIHELSGGMRQRVALARALAPNPSVLLMDEPFSALDAMTREQLYEDLQKIWAQRKKTIIFITHNVREAVSLGTRVIVFRAHPGRKEKEFPVSLPRPRDISSPHVAELAQEIMVTIKNCSSKKRD